LLETGTYFLAQYYGLEPKFKNDALKSLDTAITYMTRAIDLSPKDPMYAFKLSVCYWNKGDCDKAKKYYDICTALSGGIYNKEYEMDLKTKCK
jgi:hypothetical protein